MGKLQIGKKNIKIKEEWQSYDKLPLSLKENIQNQFTKNALIEIGYELVPDAKTLNSSSFP